MGIFTSILQNYFTDVLKLDLTFLTTLQLFSTILIVAANLVVGQLIERTRCLAGKARPWILLSALTLSVASVLMFVIPFEGTARMVWVAIAIFSALTIFLQFKFTRERVTEELLGQGDTSAAAKGASLGEQLKAVVSEKWWWLVMVFYVGFQWSGAMKNGSMAYFCKWVLDNTFFGSADA